jgi:hypothetical protein
LLKAARMNKLIALALVVLLAACATTHPSDARGDDERPPIAAPAPKGSRPMRRAGYVLIAIGSVLAVGAIAAAAASNRPGCHDEECFVPQLAAGASLGAAGGSLVITGGALAIAGRER